MKVPWDQKHPFKTLVDQGTDGMEYVSAGNNAYSMGKKLMIFYNVVFNNGIFADDHRWWMRRPEIE